MISQHPGRVLPEVDTVKAAHVASACAAVAGVWPAAQALVGDTVRSFQLLLGLGMRVELAIRWRQASSTSVGKGMAQLPAGSWRASR